MDRSLKSPWVLGAGIVVVTAAVYGQVLGHGFVNFDDELYVTGEPMAQAGLTLSGIRWAFTDISAANWAPLTRISHMIDCELFGVRAGPHLLVNLLIHLANALLLFALFQRMTKALWASAFVAAVFALHPLHVESVAWVSQRKDVLSTCFALAALYGYVAYVSKGGALRYGCALGAYALALMSKSMVVTLPCLMLLLDHWPLGRYGRVPLGRIVLEKLPFFVLAAGVSVMTIIAQSHGGAVASAEAIPLETRLAHAPLAYAMYIQKAFFPVGLAVFYPFPDPAPALWVLGICGVGLIGVSLFAFWLLRRAPHIFVGWFWFVGMLIPVIGIVQVGSQAYADRYTYLSLTGIAIIVAWSAKWFVGRIPAAPVLVRVGGALIIIGMAILTAIQIGHWQNSETLFGHAIDVTGGSSIAYNNLGTAIYEQERFAEAEMAFRSAIAMSEKNWEARSNLGAALLRLGDAEAALAEFERVSAVRPDDASIHLNAAVALMEMGRREEAVARARRALAVEPGYGKAAAFLKEHGGA